MFTTQELQKLFNLNGRVDPIELTKQIDLLAALDSNFSFSESAFYLFNVKEAKYEFISQGLARICGKDPEWIQTAKTEDVLALCHPEDAKFFFQKLFPLVLGEFKNHSLEDCQKINFKYSYRLLNHKTQNYRLVTEIDHYYQFDENKVPSFNFGRIQLVEPSSFIQPLQLTINKLSSSDSHELVKQYKFDDAPNVYNFSPREKEIIRLLKENFSSKDIASKLNLSPSTIDTHRRRILNKTEFSSTRELIQHLSHND